MQKMQCNLLRSCQWDYRLQQRPFWHAEHMFLSFGHSTKPTVKRHLIPFTNYYWAIWISVTKISVVTQEGIIWSTEWWSCCKGCLLGSGIQGSKSDLWPCAASHPHFLSSWIKGPNQINKLYYIALKDYCTDVDKAFRLIKEGVVEWVRKCRLIMTITWSSFRHGHTTAQCYHVPPWSVSHAL